MFGADANILNNKGETVRHIVASTGLNKNEDIDTRNKLLYILHCLGANR